MIDPRAIATAHLIAHSRYQLARVGSAERRALLEVAAAWDSCADLLVRLQAAIAEAERLERESGNPDAGDGLADGALGSGAE